MRAGGGERTTSLRRVRSHSRMWWPGFLQREQTGACLHSHASCPTSVHTGQRRGLPSSFSSHRFTVWPARQQCVQEGMRSCLGSSMRMRRKGRTRKVRM